MPEKLIKIAIAGSTDDGKSTLLGRFLIDSQNVPDDQLQAIEEESSRLGRPVPELAWLTDGLSTEQQKLITIDVAYRSIRLQERRIQLIDTPGHFEFLKNAATGISQSDAMVLLTDVSRSITVQTIRHLLLARIFGLRHLFVLVNKMDLVSWDQDVFTNFKTEFLSNFSQILPEFLKVIPISALTGHNVVFDKGDTKWYKGPTLYQCFLQHCENVKHTPGRECEKTFGRIQWKSPDSRYFGMKIFSGKVKPGDLIYVMGNEKPIRIQQIFHNGMEVNKVTKGECATVEANARMVIYENCMVSTHPFITGVLMLEIEVVVFQEFNESTIQWITSVGDFSVNVEIMSDNLYGKSELIHPLLADTISVLKKIQLSVHLPKDFPVEFLNRGFLLNDNRELVAITGRVFRK